MAEPEDVILGELDKVMDEVTDRIFQLSQENLNKPHTKTFKSGKTETIVTTDTGNLFITANVNRQFLKKEIVYPAPYACIADGRTEVHLGRHFEGKQINCLREGNEVLTKDGKLHKVIKTISKLKVIDKPNLVLLKSEKGRAKDGLLLTDDHLVLTYKNEQVIWEEAKNLEIGDIVFRPRKISHNKGTRKIWTRKCKNCQRIFDTIEKKVKYCSQKCYHAHAFHGYSKGKTWKLSFEQRKKHCGNKNPAWKGGISKLPYGVEWNRLLKDKIRARDNNICQKCGKHQKENKRRFHVHHIDRNKFNNSEENLVLLCVSCHAKQQWRDCELVTIDLDVFEPVKLTNIKKVNAYDWFTGRGALKKKKLWDLSIDGENSFVAKGILIHNSDVEFGNDGVPTTPEELFKWVRRKVLKGKGSEAQVRRVATNISNSLNQRGQSPDPFISNAISQTKMEFKNKVIK